MAIEIRYLRTISENWRSIAIFSLFYLEKRDSALRYTHPQDACVNTSDFLGRPLGGRLYLGGEISFLRPGSHAFT